MFLREPASSRMGLADVGRFLVSRLAIGVAVLPFVLGLGTAPAVGHATAGAMLGRYPLTSVKWGTVMNALLNCEEGTSAGVEATYLRPGPAVHLALIQGDACSGGAGHPAMGVWVFDSASSPTTAHLFQVLMDPGWFMNWSQLHFTARTISAEIYSDTCCSGYAYEYQATWTWDGTRYIGNPAAYTGPSPLRLSLSDPVGVARLGQLVRFRLTVSNVGVLPVSQLQPFASGLVPGQPLLRCELGCDQGTLDPGKSEHTVWAGPATTAPLLGEIFDVVGNIPARNMKLVVTKGVVPLPLSIGADSFLSEVSVAVIACPRDSLSLRTHRGSATEEGQAVVMVFKNVGENPCFLYGYPTVDLLGGSRAVTIAGTPQDHVGPPEPDVSPPVRLPPGGYASSTLLYTTRGSQSCQAVVASMLEVTLKDVQRHFSARAAVTICTGLYYLNGTTVMKAGSAQGSY